MRRIILSLILVFLLAQNSLASISFIQSASQHVKQIGGGITSVTVGPPQPYVLNRVVVVTVQNTDTGVTNTISDNQPSGGNTYTLRVGRTFLSGNASCSIFTALVTQTTGSAPTLTVSFGKTITAVVVDAMVFSGVDTTTQFDNQATTSGTSTSPSSGSATSSVANGLIVGSFSHVSGTFTPGTGFSQPTSGSDTAGGSFTSDVVYKTYSGSAGASYVADGSLSASSGWTACEALLRDATQPSSSRHSVHAGFFPQGGESIWQWMRRIFNV
jgi:hypothetical protein